jgi:hypothetical protein
LVGPLYIASEEDMHVYVLSDTAIAMYVKEYTVGANPNQVDREDLTDVFVRSAGMEAENTQVKPASENGKLSLILLEVGYQSRLLTKNRQLIYPCVKTVQFLSGSLV